MRAIACYRVGRPKQLQSGLALEAQRHAVERYARQHGLAITQGAGAAGARRVRGYVKALRDEGWGYARIAERLNEEGFRTTRGQAWHPMQVKRVLDRRSTAPSSEVTLARRGTPGSGAGTNSRAACG